MRRFCTAITTGIIPVKRKIIKLRDKRPIIQERRKVNQELDEKAKQLGLDWRIIGAT